MQYAKTCNHCQQPFELTEADFQPLSQAERLLCEKEGLDWSRMVKVTCTACGTSSLTNEAQIRPVTAGAAADEILSGLAARVRAVVPMAFLQPGPLDSPERRGIITKWLENLANNLDEAAIAAKNGRDRNGTPISPDQLAQTLERMVAELRKGLDRVSEVSGVQVAATVGAILDEAGQRARALGGPAPSAEPAVAVVPSRTRSSTGSGSGKRVEVSFNPRQKYRWPPQCTCCGDPNAEKRVNLKLELPDGQSLHVNVCARCAGHVEKKETGSALLGCGGLLALLTGYALYRGLSGTANFPWGKFALLAIVTAAFLIGGVVAISSARALANIDRGARRKPGLTASCSTVGDSVLWKKDMMDRISLVFMNPAYATAFIELNELQDALTIADAIATLFPDQSALIHSVKTAGKKKAALAALAERTGISELDVVSLADQLEVEEKTLARVTRDRAQIGQLELSDLMSKPKMRAAESAAIAALTSIDILLAPVRNLGVQEVELKRQKMIADGALEAGGVFASLVIMVIAGIYADVEKLLKNRREMFTLLERIGESGARAGNVASSGS